MLSLIRLYQWVIINNENDIASVHPYINQAVGFHIKGKVFGHPKAEDGSWIRTSKIVDVIKKERGVEVYTSSGTCYVLGSTNLNSVFKM